MSRLTEFIQSNRLQSVDGEEFKTKNGTEKKVYFTRHTEGVRMSLCVCVCVSVSVSVSVYKRKTCCQFIDFQIFDMVQSIAK